MPHVRVHCMIHGRVQGVYFRASTQEQALRLGLTGWVRNTSDDTVELVAEGDQIPLQRLVDWCQHGPSGAHVMRVDTAWEAPAGDLGPFAISF